MLNVIGDQRLQSSFVHSTSIHFWFCSKKIILSIYQSKLANWIILYWTKYWRISFAHLNVINSQTVNQTKKKNKWQENLFEKFHVKFSCFVCPPFRNVKSTFYSFSCRTTELNKIKKKIIPITTNVWLYFVHTYITILIMYIHCFSICVSCQIYALGFNIQFMSRFLAWTIQKKINKKIISLFDALSKWVIYFSLFRFLLYLFSTHILCFQKWFLIVNVLLCYQLLSSISNQINS